eukprot:TRINITY_DN55983_c0_g1_i1.p1 TRINITY_DN55983_c0_g1~~TRINITY_DN55983_c0_g1_i1.p1  ORF type:complete len:238 (+),score=37.20 TRINITY_DN55983_c0_g1_i1:63-776(+)
MALLVQPPGKAALALGADGAPLVYPSPLLIRNSFIEVADERPFSLEEYFEERKVRSCPTSGIETGAHGVPAPVADDAASATTSVPSAASVANEPSNCSSPSECSTADTVAHAVAPILSTPSPTQVAPQRQGLAGAFGGLSFRLPGRRLPVGPWAGTPPLPTEEEAREAGLPSRGSASHAAQTCKPCAFFNTKGCENSINCDFCHLCEPGERKKRRKEKLQIRGQIRQLRKNVQGFSL